jgi:hypothetical protein
MRHLNLFGRDRADLLGVISLTEQESLLTDPTVLVSLDRFGPQTQYLTGEIGRVFGVGIVATNLLEINEHSFINSAGVADYLLCWDYGLTLIGRNAAAIGAGVGIVSAGGFDGRRRFHTTAAYETECREAYLFNRSGLLIGDRRQFKLSASDMLFMMSDQLLLCASERIGFTSPYPRAVCKLINIGDPA